MADLLAVPYVCALLADAFLFLTGRNHHLNGMAAITEGGQRISPANTAASQSIALRSGRFYRITVGARSGWARTTTFLSRTCPRARTTNNGRSQIGFDRFYGFLGGETNEWFPDLVEDNRFTEPPYGPEEGYHLSKDLADHAIGMIRDQKASNPSKPWSWFCPGANHAPHHAPQEYIDKYKGKFDDGYDAYRKWVLPRMIAKGVVPEISSWFNPLPAASQEFT